MEVAPPAIAAPVLRAESQCQTEDVRDVGYGCGPPVLQQQEGALVNGSWQMGELGQPEPEPERQARGGAISTLSHAIITVMCVLYKWGVCDSCRGLLLLLLLLLLLRAYTDRWAGHEAPHGARAGGTDL